jgi:ADP-heptose:LPS heptosyltransferase
VPEAKGARVLIIRLDRLGDTILTTPLITALKEHEPDLELFFLASPAGAPALTGNTLIDRLIVFDVDKATNRERLRLGKLLRNERFDAVVNVNEKIWPHFWTWYSGSPIRIGFFPGITQPLKSLFLPLVLTHRIPSPNDPSRPSALHEVERYMELLRPLGIDAEAQELTVPLPPDGIEGARTFLIERGAGMMRPYVALHLTPKWGLEGWNPEFLIRLSQAILGRWPHISMIATYGAAEKEWVKPLIERLPQERFTLFFGTDFRRWACLLSQCRALVTMDTGTVHLAAALRVPVVDVFPSANFEHCSARWRPWKVPSLVVRRDAVPERATQEERRAPEEKLQREIMEALATLV